MVNYQDGKIYKITSPHVDFVYIGSTTQALSKRMGVHRAKTNVCNSKIIIDAGNARITLIEEYPCDNKEQLCRREQFFLDRIEAKGNKNRAFGNSSPEEVKAKRKKHSQKPEVKAKRAEYMKKYREMKKAEEGRKKAEEGRQN